MKFLALVALVLLVACTPRSRIAAHVEATSTITTAVVSMPPVPPAAGRASRSRGPALPSQGAGPGDLWDRVAACESGGSPRAVSGPFRGAFQFTLASWHSAGMAGDPIDFDYATQKATAMRWASMTNPFRQWPVCYPRAAGGGGGRAW